MEIPEDIQGVSLKPVLTNEGNEPSDWRKAAYYHYYEYPAEHSVKRHYGIRTTDFKLIHFIMMWMNGKCTICRMIRTS